MTVLSALGGTALIAVGSNLVIPIGSAMGGMCDLAGIVSIIMFLGLLDGE